MSTATATTVTATRPAKSEYLPFYERYIALVPDGDVVSTLTMQIGETLALLRSLPASVSTYRYAPDKWSVNQLVGHVIDSEKLFANRALRFSRNDPTPVPGFEQDDYARASTFDAYPLGELASELEVVRQSTIFSRLRGLLEVTRLVRTGEELPELLDAIARTVSDSLAFRTVVINVYRRELDDFVVSTVYGSDEAREALLGAVHQVSEWDALLDQRFLQRGAYLVPQGEFNWDDHLAYTPDLPVSDDPNAWHPDDALFAPMRGADGQLLG